MKDLTEYHQSIIHMLAHAFSNNKLFTWVARDIKNNCDRVIIGIIYTNTDGTENILPLATLNNEEEDYYEDFDFDYYNQPDFVKEEKPWWHFWH